MRNSAPQLRLEQVSLKASVGSDLNLLQNISFEVFAGDRLAIIGPSGAGKSSLLRLLNRLSEVSQGQIYFEGQEIRQIPVLSLRQQITLVPQESKLLGMTVRQALTYPLQLRGLPQSTVQQRLNTWVEQFHIPEEWLERTELQLSVGQRQWVAIARALMIQPKILLLDEPTSALDAGRTTHFVNQLIEVAKNLQITILMVNHQLEVAQQFSTRVLYLEQGQIRQTCDSEQVNWFELKQMLIDMEARTIAEWE
ncbi:MAG: hypothetical protein Kow00121_46720 [Elainellaceae cyanobacterium]